MADDIVTRDVTDPWQEICKLRDEIKRLRAQLASLQRQLIDAEVRYAT